MRRRRWLATWIIGLTACLLGGCLRSAVPPETRQSRSDLPPRGREEAQETAAPPEPAMSLSQAPLVKPDTSAAPPVKPDIPAAPPVKPDVAVAAPPLKAADLRIQEDDPPAPPADPPAPRPDIPPPPARPDAPSVKALRALYERHPEEEVREPLKQYDPATREMMRGLLGSVAYLEQSGGIARISPEQLAALLDRVHALTVPLRPRAQLTLDHMCFCNRIESYGKYQMCGLNPPTFQPGEEARVYLQVRNFASKPAGSCYKTVLKGRLEIYDETHRERPSFQVNIAPQEDPSQTPRQDFFVHIRFHVPLNCPPGSYTLWVTVEDWTDAPPGAKTIAPSRRDRKSLDFRVGGPCCRPRRASIADGTPSR